MLEECLAAPAAVARQLAADGAAYAALGTDLRQHPPAGLLTVARGSSDHAAQYLAYLVMARLGRLVTSLPMSLVTLYQSRIDCEGFVYYTARSQPAGGLWVMPGCITEDDDRLFGAVTPWVPDGGMNT